VKYVLDTDQISIVERKQQPEYATIQLHAGQHSPADVVACIVSFHEQVLGAHTYIARARTRAELVRGYKLLAEVFDTFTGPLLPFDGRAAAVLDGLAVNKIRIKVMDLRIAAIVLSVGATLVTRNARDFSQVPGLLIEDWTK
jgi:tRNA(fMet)-specific endonuclease VapC